MFMKINQYRHQYNAIAERPEGMFAVQRTEKEIHNCTLCIKLMGNDIHLLYAMCFATETVRKCYSLTSGSINCNPNCLTRVQLNAPKVWILAQIRTRARVRQTSTNTDPPKPLLIFFMFNGIIRIYFFILTSVPFRSLPFVINTFSFFAHLVQR